MFVTSAALNSLQVDGVYVYNQPPVPVAGQGINTSLAGIVGTASWGPLNTPTVFSDTASLYAAFGSFATAGISGQPFSLVTEGQFATNFSNNFLGVRVSDGTDSAATAALKDSSGTNGVTLTAKYSGTEGNSVGIVLATGSQSTSGAPTLTATLQRLGYAPEVYPNLTNPNAGGFAAALISAINNGISGVRPASQLCVASVLGSTSVTGYTATASPVSLSGGANGQNPTSSQQVGQDGTTGRTGVYALRGTGVQQFILAGNSDSTQFATLAAFAASEGSLSIVCLPSGTSSTNAISAKQTANANSSNQTLLKDWMYFTDPVSGQQRLVSPMGEALGVIASLAPEQSPGNKPVAGMNNILSTERTGTPYSYAEAQQLETAGILYVTNPIPRGAIFGFPHGQNCNPNFGSGSDTIAYTRMTNFLAASVVGLLGPFVGELQGTASNDPTRAAAKNVLSTFLNNLQRQGRISNFSVQLDNLNNTPSTIAQGFCLALVQVQYMGIIKFFMATLQGGQTVQISSGNIQ